MGGINGVEGPVSKSHVETVYVTGVDEEGKEHLLAANFDADDDPTDVSEADLKNAAEAVAERINHAEANGITVNENAAIFIPVKERALWYTRFKDHKFKASQWRPYAEKLFAPKKKPEADSSTAKPPTVLIPDGQDEFGNAGNIPSVYYQQFGAKPNAFYVSMKAVATEGKYILLEGDNGQRFRFVRPEDSADKSWIGKTPFEVQASDGSWVKADEKSVIPTGLMGTGDKKFVSVGDLRINPLAGVNAKRPAIAQDMALDLVVDELVEDYTKDDTVDAKGLYAAVDQLPKKLPVVYCYNGKEEGPVFIDDPAKLIAKKLVDRGIKRSATPTIALASGVPSKKKIIRD